MLNFNSYIDRCESISVVSQCKFDCTFVVFRFWYVYLEFGKIYMILCMFSRNSKEGVTTEYDEVFTKSVLMQGLARYGESYL